ncbi:MAG: hypothetical protein V4492_06510 [Chlamydiota bacterium]
MPVSRSNCPLASPAIYPRLHQRQTLNASAKGRRRRKKSRRICSFALLLKLSLQKSRSRAPAKYYFLEIKSLIKNKALSNENFILIFSSYLKVQDVLSLAKGHYACPWREDITPVLGEKTLRLSLSEVNNGTAQLLIVYQTEINSPDQITDINNWFDQCFPN